MFGDYYGGLIKEDLVIFADVLGRHASPRQKVPNLTKKLHLSTIRQLTSRDGFLSRTAEHLETGLVATLVGPEKKLFYASIGQMVLIVVGPDGVIKYRSPNRAKGDFARAAVSDIKPGSIIMVMHSSLADGLLPSLT